VRIDHIGVIVDDLSEAREFVARVLQLDIVSSVERDNLRSDFFACGETSIEMIEVTDPAERETRLGLGCVARIEHIAVEVDDLDQALVSLEALGVRATGPARQTETYRTFWTVPAPSDGVMYQFLERQRGDAEITP